MRITLFIIVVVILSSCSPDTDNIPSFEVGDRFLDSDVRVIEIDTFTVDIETIRLDSIITSNAGVMLVGGYNDQELGEIKASSYFETYPRAYRFLPDESELDSIALILSYNSYHYSDTTQLQTWEIYKLAEELRISDQSAYNTTSIIRETSPVITRTFQPRPTTRDSLHVSLPLSFGSQLFNDFRARNINSDEELREFLKGFAVIPSSGSTAVVGLDIDSTVLRFYYNDDNSNLDESEILDFIIRGDAPNYFTQVSSDLARNNLDQITEQSDGLSTVDSNDLAFIQSGVGHLIKITVPAIRDLFLIEGEGTLVGAELRLKVVEPEIDDGLPRNTELSLAYVNNRNEIVRSYETPEGPLTAQFDQSGREFGEVFFNIPISLFLQEKLNQDRTIDDGLILLPGALNSQLNRTVFDVDTIETKLTLRYAIIND